MDEMPEGWCARLAAAAVLLAMAAAMVAGLATERLRRWLMGRR